MEFKYCGADPGEVGIRYVRHLKEEQVRRWERYAGAMFWRFLPGRLTPQGMGNL